MRTLLERLKYDVLLEINKDIEKHPFLVEIIYQNLENNTSYNDLNILAGHQLCLCAGVNFGILEINNLFESE
jgi:hypothetical protein